MTSTDDVSKDWEANARSWIDWTRTRDVDVFYWRFQRPAFAEIVPEPGRRTVEIGCGEGRIGRWLAGQGHSVAGIDFSPTLAQSARAVGGYDEVICADAAQLPWPDNEFDQAVAFMVLHDMPTVPQTLQELARVLQPGSPFCIAIVHPINRPHEQLTNYFTEHRVSDDVEQNGMRMTFVGINRPFGAYTQALHEAGFVIEQFLEPRPDPAVVACTPLLQPAMSSPFFMHIRCRLDG